MALVIIGLMSAAVVLSLKPPDAEEEAADKFVAQINQLAKESIYTGRPHALSISESGLDLMRYADQEWVSVRNLSLGERFKVSLDIEDEAVRDIPDAPTPLILFEPTGEVTDFSLTVKDGDGPQLSLFRADDGSIQLGSELETQN